MVFYIERDKSVTTSDLPTGDSIVANNNKEKQLSNSHLSFTIKKIIDTTKKVSYVKFSPDGKFLVFGKTDINIWESSLGSVTQNINNTTAMTFSPDGKFLYAEENGSHDSVRIYSVGDWAKVAQTKTCPYYINGPNAIAVSKDSGTFAYAHGEQVTVLTKNLDEINTFHVFDFFGSALSFSSDGRTLAVSGCDTNKSTAVKILDYKSGSIISKFEVENYDILAYSSDGKFLVTGGHDNKTLVLWDTVNWNKIWKINTKRPIRSIAFSHDNKWVAAAATDEVCIWNANTGKLIASSPKLNGTPISLSFHPDSTLAICCANVDDNYLLSSVTIWKIE